MRMILHCVLRLGRLHDSCGSRLLRERRAAVALVTAVTFPLMLGFVGLASEAAMWMLIRRTMQTASDAAAYSAVVSLEKGGPACIEALAVAAADGFVSSHVDCTDTCSDGSSKCNVCDPGTTSTCVNVNIPPLSGPNTSVAGAVEVIINQPQAGSIPDFIAGFYRLGQGAVSIGARSVAASPFPVQNPGSPGPSGSNACTPSQPSACVLALDSNLSDNGLTAAGGGSATLQCDFVDNSNLKLQDAAAIINASGGLVRGSVSNSGTLTPNPPGTLNSPISDPYAGTPVPSCNCCSTGTCANTGNSTLSGVYCGAPHYSGHPAVTLSGTATMCGGTLKIDGGTFTGTGTIILSGNPSLGYANIDMNGGATLNMSAPTSGTYAGLLIYQDPNAPTNNLNKINGTAGSSYTGAIDFPNGGLTYTGNSAATAGCTQLIGYQVTFTGSSSISDYCTGTGVRGIGGVKTCE